MADIRTRCDAALAACCLLVLAGCGGGGTSVPATVPSPAQGMGPTTGPALNLQSSNSTVTYQATAAIATGASHGMNNITFSAVGQGATITLTTDASGNLLSFGVPAEGFTSSAVGKGSLTDPRSVDFSFQLSDNLALTNESSWTLSQVASGAGLTSSAFGIWAHSGNTLPGDAGVFAIGNLTPAASVPSTGSATFNGLTIGAGGAITTSSSDGGAIFFVKGNAQIIANFAAQSVATNLTNLVAGNTPLPNLTGTSAMSGNVYGGNISGGVLTGSINGNFYGSSAQETAGTWTASGGGNAYIGSYGAKQ